MAIFGFGKDKKDGGGSSESVLAYLEDAQRVRTVFTLIGPKKTEITATLQNVDEANGLLTFQSSGPMVADKGAKASFVYLQEGLRLGAATVITELRPNIVIMELPDNLEVMERRGQPRARLNPKEGATLTALTGLFEGVGITGVIENISETGARIKVDKAMSLKGEKRLPLGSALVPVGQIFMLIKLNKLPKCPAVMELEGKAVYLDTSGGGLAMGITFDKPRQDFASALRSLVASRTTAIPTTVPPKTRRKAGESSGGLTDDEPLLPPPRRTAAVLEEAKAPVAPATVIAPPPPPAAAPEPAAPPKNEALLRLKKRSRAVVALTPNSVACDLLTAFLQEEGYGRVMVTASLEEFLTFLQLPNLSLVLVDGNQSTLEALGLVRKLQDTFNELPPIILAAEDVSTAIVMAAHRSGVSQMLIKPYALDEALAELLIKQMGL
jgi:CheY-like chemotaxis protein